LGVVSAHKLVLTTNELLAFSFIGFTAVAIAGQSILAMDVVDQENVSSWSYTVSLWFFSVSYFFAGAACTHALYKKSNLVAVTMVLLVVVPLWFALEGTLFLDYYRMGQELGNPAFSHLYISEWCVFFFIGAYGFASPALRPVIVVVAVASLFSLQGRSSTVLTFATFFIYSFLIDGRKAIFTVSGVILLAAVAYFYLPIEDIVFSSDERRLDRMLLSDEEADSSLEGRADIFWFSLNHLPKSIPFGDPTFIAIKAHRMGSYIHNLLSMWQFFGLIPFLLMVVMLYRGLRMMWKKIKYGQLTVMEEIACMLLIYATISVALAKSINFYWLWFAVGYWMLKYSKDIPRQRSRSKRKRIRF